MNSVGHLDLNFSQDFTGHLSSWLLCYMFLYDKVQYVLSEPGSAKLAQKSELRQSFEFCPDEIWSHKHISVIGGPRLDRDHTKQHQSQ